MYITADKHIQSNITLDNIHNEILHIPRKYFAIKLQGKLINVGGYFSSLYNQLTG